MAEKKTGAWLHNGDGVKSTSYAHLPEGHVISATSLHFFVKSLFLEVTYDRILPVFRTSEVLVRNAAWNAT